MRWAWLLALVAAGALLFWLGGRGDAPPAPPSSALAPLPDRAEFTGSARCAGCHGDVHASWAATGHAMALGPPRSAKGAFDGKPVGDATPRQDGSALVVKVESKGGRIPGNHRVTAVVGGRTEELYLFTDARGAWRVIPIAWNVARKAWDDTHAVYEALTGDPAPGDSRQIVFNRDCAACHATRFDPGFRVDAGAESWDSTAVDLGVGCESCHGPGSVHALWHEEKRAGAYAEPARLVWGGPGGCVRCHYAHELRFPMPEDPLAPFEAVAVSRNFDGPGFFPDGRLSAAHGAGTTFVQSACFRGGATCLSCHAVHGEAKPPGDALCTGCHDGFARREHTFHDAVACVDCHMPRLLAPPLERHRDHSIRSPEPALPGTPNACNACHADKPVEWAREWKEKWYGPADARALRDAGAVVALREGRGDPEVLAGIARDPRSPLFARATALRALPQGHAAVREALGADAIDLVQVACEALAERWDPLAAPALIDLLHHRMPTVRVEAAHALARAGWRTETAPVLRADARAMFVRQYPATPLLVRSAWIHASTGGSDEMGYLLPALVMRSQRDAAPLVQRRGRDLAEAGQHTEAFAAYADARQFYGEPTPPLLDIDLADSVAATGDAAVARQIWEHAVEAFDPAGMEHAIARARLLGVEGRGEEGRALLEPFAARLSKDPVGADLLVRVRWSLRALEAP